MAEIAHNLTASGLITGDVFDALRKLDTCTVSNAIERLNVRLRNEGFVYGDVRCQFPQLPPMLGYAATSRIRTSSPPMAGACYYDRMDWWNYVASLPEPRVIVIQDADHVPGVGALVGEIHASIAQALKCVGCVTNGAVRDLQAVEALGFHLFACHASVSHAYAHVIEFGQPVEVGGLKIQSGDLVHGDQNGVHVIPLAVAAEVPRVAQEILNQERELLKYCRSRNFSLRELEGKMRRATRAKRHGLFSQEHE